MTSDPIEYEPLERLFSCLEEDPDDLSEAELKESLLARGLDPDATTEAVASKVNSFLKSCRLSWKEAARQKQTALQLAAKQAVSWTTRKKEEIEAAYAEVQNGSHGSVAQLKLQAAFRNLSDVPTEDKASFLDEIDLLCRMKDMESDSPDEIE